MTPSDLIKEARELSEKATPGPWSASRIKGLRASVHFAMNGQIVYGDRAYVIPQSQEDAAFIARSRALVMELAEALEEADARFQDAKKTWGAITRETNAQLTARASAAENQRDLLAEALRRMAGDDCHHCPHQDNAREALASAGLEEGK